MSSKSYKSAKDFRSPRLLASVPFLLLLTTVLSSCGGGGTVSTGGGGGGGGGSGPSISQLAPSSVAVGVPQGEITIYGQGFAQGSQALMDSQPLGTAFVNSSTLTAQLGTSFDYTKVATHQVSVEAGSQVSNSLPFTVFEPAQAANLMQAFPGFLVGTYEVNPSVIVAADVNGDGLADVIMPGPGISNSESIAILDGQSDGTLATVQYVPVPTTPYALAVGDVDGNSTQDIVAISGNNSSSTPQTTVTLLLGDGHGNFQAPVTAQTVAEPSPLMALLADLDGDGQLDLVLSVTQPAGTAASIVWLKNIGGGFAAPITLTTTATGQFSVADFNVDGKPDIVYVTAGSSSAVHILMNQGGDKFKDQLAGGLNSVVGVPNVIDFNLDGIPDLVVEVQQLTGDQLFSFQGKGDGSFTQVAVLLTPPIAQLVAGDFDHDGFPDLAGPGGNEPSEMIYFFGDGHGNFTLQTIVGPEGQYAAVGDFNGDGIPDVVVPDEFSFVTLALGRTGRNFPSPVAISPATLTSLWTGKIIPNGLPGIFAGGDNINKIPGTFFINDGNGVFTLGAYTDPSSGMLADLTGKGVVDLLGGPIPTLEVWPNNGTAAFSPSPITLAGQTDEPPIVADFDGDGYPDVLVPGRILYGNGTYQFTAVALPTEASGTYAVGDFNGDGKLDIVSGNYTFLNAGNRTFQSGVQNTLPLTNGTVFAVGDFNGDGKDDIAINLPGDNSISIWYSKGDGTFYEGTQLDPGQEPAAFVAGDFNGDGKIDLAVGLMWSHQACLLLNAGQGQFTRSFFATGAFSVGIATADLNGDGKADLVFANFVVDFAPPNIDVVFHQ